MAPQFDDETDIAEWEALQAELQADGTFSLLGIEDGWQPDPTVIPHPVTLYNDDEEVVGLMYTDGHVISAAPSRVGQPALDPEWPEWDGVVVWDGAMPDPRGGRQRGALLGGYDSQSVIANWQDVLAVELPPMRKRQWLANTALAEKCWKPEVAE